jgi:hypothetical protein
LVFEQQTAAGRMPQEGRYFPVLVFRPSRGDLVLRRKKTILGEKIWDGLKHLLPSSGLS